MENLIYKLLKRFRDLPLLGQEPVSGSIEPAQNTKKLLFGAVAFSVMITYIMGVLTTQDYRLFLSTSPVAFACLGLVGLLYLLSRVLSVFYCLPVLILVLLSILYLPHSLGFSVGLLLVAIGLLGIGYLFWKSKEQVGSQFMMGALAALAMMGSTLKASLVGPVLINWFNNMDRSAHGAMHQDHLFHAAIAAMIKNYGVAATGLQGLVEIHYHVLFHKVTAALSIMTGNPVLEVFGIIPRIFFFPLLLMSLVLPVHLAVSNPGLRENVQAWAWACILVLVIPVLLGPWAVWFSFMSVESTLLSFCLFLLTIPILLKWSFSWMDVLFISIFACLIAHSKGSVGLVFLGMLALKTMAYSAKDGRSWICLILVGAISFVILFRPASGAAESYALFDPLGFSFIRRWSLGGQALEWVSRSRLKLLQSVFVVASFLVFHFLCSWVVLGRAFANWRTSWRSPAVVLNIAAVLPAVAILSAFNLASSMYWFTCIGLMTAFPFILAMAVKISSGFRRPRLTLATIFFLSLVLNLGGFKEKFAEFAHAADSSNGGFFKKLCAIRNQTFDKNEIFNPAPDFSAANPVERVSAKPFIYPAVSERVWFGLFDDNEINNETYVNYGYSVYFTKNPDGFQTSRLRQNLLDQKKVTKISMEKTTGGNHSDF